MESLNKAPEVKSIMESNESPKNLDPSSSSSSDASESMCVICLSEIKKGEGKAIFTGECSHSFHFGCIAKSVEEGNRICPICRFQWTQVPICNVGLLESVNELKKKMLDLDKILPAREVKIQELEKKMPELEKIRREMENELESRNKIILELKRENHELKKKNQDQEVEAGEENTGHKDSDKGVEAEKEMEGTGETEGGSKKRKKTIVRSPILTRQKTRKLDRK